MPKIRLGRWQVPLVEHDQPDTAQDETRHHQHCWIPPDQVMVDQRIDTRRVVEGADLE